MSAEGRGRQVAMLHPCYWPEVRRGSERFIHDLGSGLPSRGFEPTLITSHRRTGRTRRREDGITVVRHRRPPEWPLHRLGVWEYALHLPMSYGSLRAGQFELSHALYATDGLVANRWSHATGRPSVLSIMGIPNREQIERSIWRRRMWQRITGDADRVVFLSRYAAEASAWLTPGEVIQPGVDLDLFAASSERSVRPRLFAPSAAEDPRKRVALLVEAVERLRRRLPDLELVVGSVRVGMSPAGFDPAEHPWIRSVNLDDHRVLTDSYSSSWLTVHAARDEAFGLVLAESLACGTPVVAPAAGAGAEIINCPEEGATFAEDSPDAIAETIEHALSRGGEAVRRVCRARATEFDADRTADAYAELYRGLLGGRP